MGRAAITSSKEDALAMLAATRARMRADGQRIADEIIAKKGETHTGEIYEVMCARNLIDHSIKLHWMGTIFHNTKRYRWTGRTIETENGHFPSVAKIWTWADERKEFG